MIGIEEGVVQGWIAKGYIPTYSVGKYEWDSCSDNLSGTANAVKSFYNYPKKVFKWYKSAEVHNKQSFKLPLWVFVPLLGVLNRDEMSDAEEGACAQSVAALISFHKKSPPKRALFSMCYLFDCLDLCVGDFQPFFDSFYTLG
ncbi:MAG: hypothetical protein HY936_11205 [Nitrosomonadales bacterium]|nr:hypothetical protein [Nitrosomonadales bacterium]